MTRARKFSIGWAALCALAAAWDFTAAVIFGGWFYYALGALMVACAAFHLRQARPRKAPAAMPSNDPISSELLSYITRRYGTGGYVYGAATSTTPPQLPVKKDPAPFQGLPFDFAVGEVYGMRMWRMDQYGRLGARNWKGLWKPGVNVAKCIQRESVSVGAGSYSFATGEWRYSERNSHPAPFEGCSCGFYAYTDPHHAETQSFTNKNTGEAVVLGIIKGTGRTLIGTQGFRCEKAEIVALRDPTRGGEKTEPWRLRQLANLKRVYPDVPLLPSRAALLEFAPLTETLPDPTSDEFWDLP